MSVTNIALISRLRRSVPNTKLLSRTVFQPTMMNQFFQNLEGSADGESYSLPQVKANLSFNRNGLIPVITQDHRSRTVLMMAWMNQQALEHTLSTGHMTYWSRSRSQLWKKGETSGNYQRLIEMRFDCDGDAILCSVEQHGPACHTGRPNCFYLRVDNEQQCVYVQGDAK
jgi:phosphoribosyl-AMP cyclohydrolase